MAIDSALKRKSIAAIGALFLGPVVVPDGAIAQADRQTIAGSYAGILAAEPAAAEISQRFYEALVNYSALTDIVSTRIRPTAAKDDESVPYVVYWLSDAERFNTLTDAIGPGKYRDEFDVACWARTHKQARQVFDEVMNALAAADFQTIFLQTADAFDRNARLYSATGSVAVWE